MLLGAVALTLPACSSEESSAGSRFEPVHPGVLTVATAFLPALGFWEGDPPTSGGFEAGLADALAEHLGLDRVEVVQVPFGRSWKASSARPGALQLTPSDEREGAVRLQVEGQRGRDRAHLARRAKPIRLRRPPT